MKNILLVFTLFSAINMGCKVKSTNDQLGKEIDKPLENKVKAQTQAVSQIENKTLGKVSHRYKATGCNTVIEVQLEAEGEIQTLIPKDKLAQEFDVDGTELYFNFLLLRMPQPEGCSLGQPADIMDVVKKK